jgi:hypothetical protein
MAKPIAMKNTLFLLPCLLVFLFLTSCKSDCIAPDACDEALEQDTHRYENAMTDDFDLSAAEVDGDCLLLTVRYGGGCGTVDFDLVAIKGSRYSLPPQVPMRLILDDDDPCEAYLSKELSFNLKPLQDQGAGTVMLDLEGWGEMLEYAY